MILPDFFCCYFYKIRYNDKIDTNMESVMTIPSIMLKHKLVALEADMMEAAPERLRRDFKEICRFRGHKDFHRVCGRIMWRLINSVKKAETGLRYDRRDRMVMLLNEFIPQMEVDNKNKQTALAYIVKHNIFLSDRLRNFLQTYNPNEAYLQSTHMRLREIKEYYRKSEDFNLQTFMNNTTEFLNLLADRDTDSKQVHFSALYTMMQRRTQAHGSTVQINLFDEDLRQKEMIDKNLVRLTALIYARQLVEAREVENVSPHYLQKFKNMMVAVVSKNSFSREEVKQLAKEIKNQRWVSRSVEENLNDLSNKLVDVYDFKQEKEVRELNAWYDRERKQKPLEQAARRRVYVNMLYRKFIEDFDIGREKPDNLYKTEKDKLKQEISRRYSRISAEGKEPADGTLIQNEVLSEYKERDQDRFRDINRMMNKRCLKCGFFFKVLRNAKESGLKYIYPPALMNKDNSKYLH